MTLLRSIVVLFALLAQAMPASAMLNETTTVKCSMGCCAWLEEAGITSCDCAESPSHPEPANVPPVSGRERVPQVVWATVDEDGSTIRSTKVTDDESKPRLAERDRDVTQPVGLPVLFCSLLN